MISNEVSTQTKSIKTAVAATQFGRVSKSVDAGTTMSALTSHSFTLSTRQELLETLESAVSDLHVPKPVLNAKVRQAATASFVAGGNPSPSTGNRQPRVSRRAMAASAVESGREGSEMAERTIRLFAAHELRTAFYTEE